MTAYLTGVWVVLALELRQRVRGSAWYVLLAVFVILVAAVTLLLWWSLSAIGDAAGGGIFSSVIYFVLLLGTLVTPALSGNAVNGDRDAGTLATTQVTLVSTGQLLLGKFLSAWITALAFLAAAVPFLLLAVVLGGIFPDTIVVSVLVLAAELGVVAALGVGLSAIITRPLFSVATTYLAVAALSVGTLIAFALGGSAMQSTARHTYIGLDYSAPLDESGLPEDLECLPPQTSEQVIPRFDRFWGVLAANPYVVLADAAPTHFDADGAPVDLFGWLKTGVRTVQIPPDLDEVFDECELAAAGWPAQDEPSPREVIESTAPSWFVGLTIHLALAAAALAGGWARTRTPARRLARGSRVA